MAYCFLQAYFINHQFHYNTRPSTNQKNTPVWIFPCPTAWGFLLIQQMNSFELWAYVYSKCFKTEDFCFFRTLLITSERLAKFNMQIARYHIRDNYKLFPPPDISMDFKIYLILPQVEFSILSQAATFTNLKIF